MSNLSQFISGNLLLCIVFVLAILIYLAYEIRQAKFGRLQLSVQEAINLANREKGIFLDIRNRNLYNESHIIGAVNSSSTEIKLSTKALDKYKNNPIIIYCTTDAESASACDLLKKNGFDKIYTLKGGFKQWLQNKLPLDTKLQKTEPKAEKKRKI